jgi:hypothetical protein
MPANGPNPSTIVHGRFPTYIGPVLDPRQDSAVPRKVRDSNLETRTARSRLPVRHKPYFR